MGYQGVSVQRGRHSASVGYRFVSERFTDEANTPHRALDAYGLCNVWYQSTWKKNELTMDVTAGVDNVFDVAFETLRAYAMPGRIYRLSISLSYQPNKSQNLQQILE
jgi:outer membrane cobalamin receptor